MRAGLVTIVAVALVACGDLPDGVERVTIDPATYWGALGAFELVPPVRLPTQAGGRSRTSVRVVVPEGAVIDVDGDGRLRFPIGTIADRVEEVHTADGWVVADVRGSTLTAEGERFHLLRPEHPGAHAPLVGYAWPRAEPALDAWVHDRVASAIEHDGQGLVASAADDRRAVMAQGVRDRGDCARCHAPGREPDARASALVHRGTDASGFHVPQSVLDDAALAETYRADDGNDGPFVTAQCVDGAAERVSAKGRRRWVCADGRVPLVRFDVGRALAAGDAHAAAVCASRRWLWGRLSDEGRRRYAAAMAACHKGGEGDQGDAGDDVGARADERADVRGVQR